VAFGTYPIPGRGPILGWAGRVAGWGGKPCGGPVLCPTVSEKFCEKGIGAGGFDIKVDVELAYVPLGI